jgi:cytochrome c oxidase cbb3-type subunit 4
MDYEAVVILTQLLALFFFILMFTGVVAYVLWPGNKNKFDRAAQLPFEPGGVNQERKG